MSNNPDPLGDMFSSKDPTTTVAKSTKPQISLSKGLLTNLKPKQSKDPFSTTSTADPLFSQPQQTSHRLTTADKLVREQYFQSTHSTDHDDESALTKSGAGKRKQQSRSNMFRGAKGGDLDWDLGDDSSLDRFSANADSTLFIERDMLGNIKKQRLREDPRDKLAEVAAPLICNPNNLGLLGMESDDIVHLSTRPAVASPQTVEFNTITNSLGMNRVEKQYHIQSKPSSSSSSSSFSSTLSFLPAFQTIGTQLGEDEQLTEREKVLQRDARSLLPRNRKLLSEPTVNWTDKTIDEMTPSDWDILREDHRIVTRGKNVPNPLRFWSELDYYAVPTGLLDAIKTVGYQSPTPIQRIAMPVSLLNRDIIARAQTGSGKTCSFLIPVLTYISKQPKLNEKTCQDGPYGIILAPSRELATQIFEEAKKMTQFMHDINVACVIGGQKEYKLEDRIELLIATPGRLVEFINQRVLVLNQCRYIILDEADRMLDDGFEPQVQQILDCMPSANPSSSPTAVQNSVVAVSGQCLSDIDVETMYQDKRRRTMLYSATFSPKIENLAKKYMQQDYVQVEVGDKEFKINRSITQIIEWCHNRDDNLKLQKLCHYINNFTTDKDKVIIFLGQKEHVDALCSRIKDIAHNRAGKLFFERHIKPVVLHSDATDREANLRGFKEDQFNVLLATDVAGRGIDVKEVSLVINYELTEYKRPTPGEPFSVNLVNPVFEAYTHRVGRTGRAGNKGTAVTFLNDDDRLIIPMFKQFLLKNGVKHFPRAIDEIEANGMDNKPIIH